VNTAGWVQAKGSETAATEADPKECSILGAERFGRLCADVPHSEVMKNRILLSDLDTTISETVPDGGLDSKINANDIDINSDWLPKGTRVWQFTSGQ